MDCQQVAELLDAYAIGAVTADEARAIEEHVAGCVACWEELGKAQRVASLIALTVPLHPAPAGLGDQIMAAAEREVPEPLPAPSFGGMLSKLRLGWQVAAGVMGTVAAAVLVFAFFLQLQVNNLDDDNSRLQTQFADSQANFADMIKVATAPDVKTVSLTSFAITGAAPTPVDPPSAEYRWSGTESMGVLFCRNLPSIPEDKVYQAWYQTPAEPVSGGTFQPNNGGCYHLMRPVTIVISATGVGISLEQKGGSARPSGRWLIFGTLK